jgi:hypothetical protein
MAIRNTLLAATAVAAATVGAAQAEGLRPIAAQGIDLGAVAGVAYYTVEGDGFRVVATFAQEDESGTPVRVETVLAPGQSVTFSTPRGVGVAPNGVEISRLADRVLVHAAVAATN